MYVYLKKNFKYKIKLLIYIIYYVRTNEILHLTQILLQHEKESCPIKTSNKWQSILYSEIFTNIKTNEHFSSFSPPYALFKCLFGTGLARYKLQYRFQINPRFSLRLKVSWKGDVNTKIKTQKSSDRNEISTLETLMST